MISFSRVIGLVTRWVLAALAAWWFFWFITLIGESSDKAQELAGMAIAKAVICGAVAGIWFYRANQAKAAETLKLIHTISTAKASSIEPGSSEPDNRSEADSTDMDKSGQADAHGQNILSPHIQTSAAISLEPSCKYQETTSIVCCECGKESADEFRFCPYCGKAFPAKSPAVQSQGPSLQTRLVPEVAEREPTQTADVPSNGSNEIGTYVFGAFSAISVVVSITKGIVPIYLVEAAIWAGCAWYWHRRNKHSELAKAIVVVLAVLIAIGEVIHIASQANPKATAPTVSDPFAAYGGHEVAPAEASVASHVANVEEQAVALFNQKQYKEARPLFEQSCNGTDENGFKYAGFDGEMKACNYLGFLYAKGLGGPRDRSKAQDLYQRACDHGVLSSCASLGSLYKDAGNSDDASKYFSKACQGGVTEACSLLRGVK